ncbi:MAG TPA: hypothetical protein VNS34_20605 [Rhizobiaceae bacterium]|nr:hypothetical protein [Rhizobiaceae bacterium]
MVTSDGWAICIIGKLIGAPIAGAMLVTAKAATTVVAPKQDVIFFMIGSSLMKSPLLIQQKEAFTAVFPNLPEIGRLVAIVLSQAAHLGLARHRRGAIWWERTMPWVYCARAPMPIPIPWYPAMTVYRPAFAGLGACRAK